MDQEPSEVGASAVRYEPSGTRRDVGSQADELPCEAKLQRGCIELCLRSEEYARGPRWFLRRSASLTFAAVQHSHVAFVPHARLTRDLDANVRFELLAGAKVEY